MKKTTIPYYLSSLKSIVMGFHNWYAIPLLLFLHPLPFTIKNRGAYYADNLMDIWTLKEVLLDDCYRLNKKKYPTVIDIGGAIMPIISWIFGRSKRYSLMIAID